MTWLRGVVPTDSAGIAEFDSVVPGWYAGRAVHVHVKVSAVMPCLALECLIMLPGLTRRLVTPTPRSLTPVAVACLLRLAYVLMLAGLLHHAGLC